MEPKSVFLKQEGFTPKNKIWDFLIVHSEFDYSMADIAKYSDVGYSTLKKLWPYFKKNKLVVRTRTVGKAKMYKLNRKNPVVETFIEYFWTVVDSVVNKELSKSKKNRQKFIDSGSISVPVSTRHL